MVLNHFCLLVHLLHELVARLPVSCNMKPRQKRRNFAITLACSGYHWPSLPFVPDSVGPWLLLAGLA